LKWGQTEREEGCPLLWHRSEDKRRVAHIETETNRKRRGAVPSSGVEAGTNGEGGGLPALKRRQMEREGAAPPLVLKWGQTEREEVAPSGIKTETNGEREGAAPSSGIEAGTNGEGGRGGGQSKGRGW